ncbi:MAG: response regulator, partial [Proteobacteria bacterium]|nr:response regulator [Pseudomonadota bacterium]
MTAKRALIVDDSKSARVVLSRLLEKHDLTVDTTDSAESALVYLREHRPDIIFMDQVMSGMDGLSAVQAIKSDPSTASIPIMMYTSQDGELYAGEARASGAVGVLAKRMAPADIASALQSLQLLPDRRAAEGVAFDRVELPAVDSATGALDGVIVPALAAEAP